MLVKNALDRFGIIGCRLFVHDVPYHVTASIVSPIVRNMPDYKILVNNDGNSYNKSL